MTIVEKLGYSLGPLLSMQDVLSCAKMADATANVDSLWVPESWGRESFATLGAISQLTGRPRLGTSIVNIFSRTPATVAMAATTLDMLSSSRTIIGLGASTEAIIENWHGTKFEKPLGRMREFVECLRMMIRGEKVDYDGQFFRVRNFRLLHQPVRKEIPIFMAAVNGKMVSLASQAADGIILYLRPLDELKHTVAKIKREAAGKRLEVACSLICAMSTKDPDKARKRAATTLAFYIAVGKYYGRFLSENGFRNEVASISDEYKKNGADAAAKLVSDRMLQSLTISGDAEECVKALSRFISTGITLPIIQVNPIESSESSFRELLSTFRDCAR
jgi:alkanesulfonate monooxygenase SsuD/methylene tetrahydromethanopterin reductase-like flavin-dependent oxidoreductase (luciferase family)